MSHAKSEKKYCRACLNEIRNNTTFTNFMQPPEPDVYLRDDVKAKTYLQCYYFCMKSTSTRFNITYLPDHPYICDACKGKLMSTVDFIVKSQKNEYVLKSMYENNETTTKDDSTAAELSIDLLDDAQVEDFIETYVDETEILEEELQDIGICEIETLSEVDNVEEVGIEVCDVEKYNMEQDDDVGAEEIHHTIEVVLPTRSNVCKPEKNRRAYNRKEKRPSTKTYGDHFKCLLCTETFKLQRSLYQHYDDKHDKKNLAYPCDICKRRHISQKALTFHKHRVHSNIEYEDCQVCGEVLLPAFFKEHKDRHKSSVKYACYRCDRTFDRHFTLKQHHKEVHGRDCTSI